MLSVVCCQVDGRGGYDLILSRRMLQHLTMHDVAIVLGHASAVETGDMLGGRPRPAYLLATTFADSPSNGKLPDDASRFYYVNLGIPPISIELPLCLTRDHSAYTGMWQLPVRRVVDCDDERKPVAAVRIAGWKNDLYSCIDWSL